MKKSADAFRTISEVADWLDTPAHVLRFWESKFPQIKPVKRAGGRRYYRPKDMLLIGGIKKLLHKDGLTIKGAKKVLSDHGQKHVCLLSQPLNADMEKELELNERKIAKVKTHKAQPKAGWKPVDLKGIATNLDSLEIVEYPEVTDETLSNFTKISDKLEEAVLLAGDKDASNHEKQGLKQQAKGLSDKEVFEKFASSIDPDQASLKFWDEDGSNASEEPQYLPENKKTSNAGGDTSELEDEIELFPNVIVTANQFSILDHLTKVQKLSATQERHLRPLLSKLEKTIHQRQRRTRR